MAWGDAEKHLVAADPVLGEIIERVGPCTLSPRKDYFATLCKSIISQQISVLAARSVMKKFRGLFPRGRLSPKPLLKMMDEQLRSAGISRQKARYLRSLAEAFASGAIPTRRWHRMEDEEIVQALIPVLGIGRWTAEMFMIFVLNRPDLLPVDDLGFCNQVQRAYGLKKYPDAKKLGKIAERWRPYRSIATWYMWRAGHKPVTKSPALRAAAQRVR